MVKFEAAKAICSLEDILPASVITTAVSSKKKKNKIMNTI